MTINELFAGVNGFLAEVDVIIDSLTDPNRTTIDQYYDLAWANYQEMLNWHTSSYNNLDKYTGLTIRYLLYSYDKLVKEYDDTISEIRLGVDKAFTDYYDQITYKLEYAIGLTWNEIQESETYVLGQIAAVQDVILNTVNADLAELDTKLTGMIDAVRLEFEEQDDSLLTKILDAAAEVYDYVTSQVSAMLTTVSTWLDELWDYVGSIMTWLGDKFNEFYIQITDWVSESISAVYARLSTEVTSLMGHIEDYYNRAESLVSTAKAWLVSEINRLGDTLRGLLDAAIVEVTDLLDNLALLTDWRFTFFNLSLSFPELSFLQVLNRDEETFNRFKPYWQALFARVMEEE